jgi:hypothetical protein
LPHPHGSQTRTFRHLLAAFFGPARGGMLGLMYETPNIQDLQSQVSYVESSIRPGVTIDQYRRSRPRRPSRWERLKSLGGGAQPAIA